jgi:Rnl2 family RNA ligase
MRDKMSDLTAEKPEGFTEYEHMENHYNLNKMCDIAKIDPDMKFVCTEKIHGTNYSFVCDGSDVVPCRRGASLGTDRSFMNHGHVYDRYAKDVLIMYNYIKDKYNKNLLQIQLYGELFGGYYNGKTSNKHKKVQSGVNYHHENEFMAYDLKIQTTDNTYYLDYDKFKQMFDDLKDDIKIKHVPVIAICTFADVLKLNPVFESVVYSHYELNKLENNYAEGYVVRPVTESFMPKISEEYQNSRLIFKLKNPSFSETIPETKPEVKPKSTKPNYADILKRYLTDMRYDNVKSKLTDDEQDKLKDKLYDDVLVDFLADNAVDAQSIELCKKQLGGLVIGYLKKREHAA